MNRQSLTLAALSIALLFATATFWIVVPLQSPTKLRLTTIPSPAAEAAGSLVRAILEDDLETVSSLLCNRSAAHRQFVAAELVEVNDLRVAAQSMSLESILPKDGSYHVDIRVPLAYQVRGYETVNAAITLEARYGYCVSYFAFDRASWHYLDEAK